MSNGQTLQDSRWLSKRCTRLLFCPSDFLKCLQVHENRGKAFCCMVHQVLVRPISLRHVLQKWKKAHFSRLVQATSCQNMSESLRRLSRLFSRWLERRNQLSSSLMRLTRWWETDQMDKTKQVEESRLSSLCRCRVSAMTIKVSSS